MGVDPSEAAISHARRRALPAMTFTTGTAQALPLPDASFDVVTCTLPLPRYVTAVRPDRPGRPAAP
jgi:ubiquinone/menaquinone biosynthesis C-methylase UbiE